MRPLLFLKTLFLTILFSTILFVTSGVFAEDHPSVPPARTIQSSEIMRPAAPPAGPEILQMFDAAKGLNSVIPGNSSGKNFTKYGYTLFSHKDSKSLWKEVSLRGGMSNPFKAQSAGFQFTVTW